MPDALTHPPPQRTALALGELGDRATLPVAAHPEVCPASCPAGFLPGGTPVLRPARLAGPTPTATLLAARPVFRSFLPRPLAWPHGLTPQAAGHIDGGPIFLTGLAPKRTPWCNAKDSNPSLAVRKRSYSCPKPWLTRRRSS
jgi:hypothetical protein